MPRFCRLLLLCIAVSLFVLTSAHAVTWVKANGQTSVTLTAGQSWLLTMDCTAGGEILVLPVLDANDNGTYDSSDEVMDAWLFVDNSWVDEDTRSGYYKETLNGPSGLYAGKRFILVATQLGSAGTPSCSAVVQLATTSQGISGRVTQSNGLPAAGVSVGTLLGQNLCFEETEDNILGDQTDANGDFVICVPSAGNYIVAVIDDPRGEPACLREVTVSAGSFLTSVNFQLRPELPECSQGATYTISGTVKDGSNRVLPGARVSSDNKEVRANLQGVYELQLPAGTHSFDVGMQGYVPDQPYSLDVSGNATFNMTMHRAAYSVQGVVRRSSDSQTLPGAQVEIESSGLPYYSTYEETNATGRYLLWTDAGTGIWIGANKTSGPYEVFSSSIDVTGNKTYDMVVPVRNATFSGTIRDGASQPVAWVELTADNKTRSGGKTITSMTKSDGTYTMSVTPGDAYTISFWKPGYDNPLGNFSLPALTAGQTYTLNRTLDFISNPPTLCGGEVTPTSGEAGTEFRFEVTYTDEDNDPPYGVFVQIDGMNHPMQAANPSDYNFTDGAVFVYSTVLDVGAHDFSFGGSDTAGAEAKRCTCEPESVEGPCVYARPVNVGFSPDTGSAPTSTWLDASSMWTDADGFANISKCHVLMNSTLNGANAAYTMYDQNQNKLYVRNDANTAWLGGYAPGSAQIIENSYCKLNCAATTVIAAEDYVQIGWKIWFKPSMLGKTCPIWLKVEDDYALSDGWDQMGLLTIGESPFNVSLTPSAGSFAPLTWQTLTGKYSDPDGYANLANCYFLVNPTADPVNGVFVRYDAVNNLLYLKNDASTSWLGGYAPGTANFIENTRGKLDCALTTVSKSGLLTTVNWKLMFKTPISGKTYPAWMLVYDAQNNRDGYDQMGTFTINSAPSNVSVSPNTGTLTGIKIAFTSRYSDPDGYAKLANCYFLVNTTLDQVNAAFVRYDQNTNLLYVKNDANTSWGTGRAPGSAYVLENSYCKLYCAETTVSGSGTTLTVSWKIEFKPTMSGRAVKQYMLVFDDANAKDGWDQVGSITLNRLPVNVSLTPTVGPIAVGVKQTFTSKYSDADGVAHLANGYLLFNTSLNQVNAVFLRYDANTGLLYVKNDANTDWGVGYAPGSANVLENSRCKLYCAETTVSQTTTTRTVNWKIEFKAPLSGTCSAWLLVFDDLGGKDGWDQMASGIKISQTPVNVSLDPNLDVLDVGIPTTLTSVYSDPDGYGDIRDCYLLINTSLNQANAVFVRYDAVNNLLYIKDDANSAWVGGIAPGTAGSMENSQGILWTTDTSVEKVGSTITVSWSIEMKSFVGLTCPAWMLIYDRPGLRDGWEQMGSFSVQEPI